MKIDGQSSWNPLRARRPHTTITIVRRCSNDSWPLWFCKSIATQMGEVLWYKWWCMYQFHPERGHTFADVSRYNWELCRDAFLKDQAQEAPLTLGISSENIAETARKIRAHPRGRKRTQNIQELPCLLSMLPTPKTWTGHRIWTWRIFKNRLYLPSTFASSLASTRPENLRKSVP